MDNKHTNIQLTDKSNKQCMSHKNNLESNIRCLREVSEGDFCRYHKRYKKYMKQIKEEILDEEDTETLMGYYDSWKEVPEVYRIKLNKWWDIRILVEIIANQLCTNDMSNPKPNFPFDPFTRINFTPEELDKIKNKIREIKLPIYVGLIEFLNCDFKKLYSVKNTEYNTMIKIITILEKKLRYRTVNLKNSQDCFTGIWVSKKDKLSEFEKLLSVYHSTPEHAIANINGEIVVMYNPKKDILMQKINNYPIENMNLSDNLYTALL
jgi:hypothetical protein